MDFDQFDSRKAAATAKPLHLRNPADNKRKLYDTGDDGLPDERKPCLIYLYGTESARVQEAQAILRRERAKAKDDDKDAEQTMADLQASLMEGIRPMVSHFENVNRGDALAKAPDDVEWFFGLQMLTAREGQQGFLEQAVSFVSDRSNYLGNGASK